MGAIVNGIIQGLGQYQQQKSTQNILAQVKANEDMAQMLDQRAGSAQTPQDAIELHQLAAKYRTLGAKKPTKDMDLHNIFQQKNLAQIQQTQQQQQQQNSQQAQAQKQQIQQAQGTVAQGTGLTPPADNVQGPAGGMSQPPQVPTGLQGLAPPNPTSAAGAPSPAASPDTPPPSPATPAPQSQAGNPPPISGLPSPGFNTVAPANTPSLGPGEFVSPTGPTAGRVLRSPFRTPQEEQEFEARGAGLKQGAVEQAGVAPAIAKARGTLEAQYELYDKKFKEVSGYVDRLNQNPNSDIEWTVAMGANGLPIAKMDRGVGTGIVTGSQVGDLPVIGGGVKQPDATYTLIRFGNGKEKLSPVSPILGQGYTTDATGKQVPVQYNKRVPGSAAAAGIQPPATFNPKLFNMQGGGVGLASPAQIEAGSAPAVVPGALGTGAPTTSTLNVPGQLPQTTTRVKGAVTAPPSGLPAPNPAGRPAPSARPAPSTNPAAPNAAVAAAADNSPIAVNYRNWVAGKATLTDKEQTAARQYAASRGLPTPNILDANAQKAVAAINPILEEIVHARQMLRQKGLLDQPELESKLAMTKAFLKYRAGFTDPLTKAISDLSFDRIRSVGQALQGTGSRAYPIFQMGLEHTPQIGLNSDSAKMMDNKLEGMERRARESIAAAMTENKSGVAPQLQPPGVTPPAAAMPPGVPQVGDQFGSGRVVHIQRVQ